MTATSSEKTELALRSISMAWLLNKLFEKYAPRFSDKLDWKGYKSLGREARKQRASEFKAKLRRQRPSDHNELCGALNIIMIAARSRKIKAYMMSLTTKKGAIRTKFNLDCGKQVSGDGQPNEPVNLATWFCIHEEDMREEANKIKQYALNEDQRYYNWTWYNTTQPTKGTEGEETLLKEFENALKGIFKKEKDDKKFPVRASRLDETKTFIRYCVSTAKDPIEAFLARNGAICSGNDPTANTFLIDYFFNCDVFRVAFPGVIDAERVASLFANHVLGAELTPDEPAVFLKAMRRFATEKECNGLIEAAKKSADNIHGIQLKAMRLTVADSPTQAEAYRNRRENAKRLNQGLRPLPRLRCEVFEEDNIFDEIRKHFSPDLQRKELLDVFELVFRIDLYKTEKQEYLSPELRRNAPTCRYWLSVTPRKIRFKPRIVEIPDPKHRATLDKIQKALNITNDLAVQVVRASAE